MLEKYDVAVELFLKNCTKDGLSAETISGYGRTYKYYRSFCSSNGLDAGIPATMRWKLSLEVSMASLNLYLRHLMYLSEFAISCGLLDAPLVTEALMPPAKKVAAERAKPYAHILTEEDAAALISADHCIHTRTPATFLRERAEVTLLLLSGLRNSELRALTPNDLDWDAGLIHARITKGDKPRWVPFPETAQKAVRLYLLSNIRPRNAGNDAPLFGAVGKDGEWHGFSRTHLSDQVHSYTKAILGEEKAARTHAMRHGYASILLEHDAPVQYISESLGHASLATTAIYSKRLHPERTTRNVGDILDGVFAGSV